MKKFTFLLTLLFAFIGVTSHAQDVFRTSDAPSATDWAENTTWYKMTLKNFYLSTLNVDANGYLYANKADQFYGEQSWWCIVGNEETGYKFYNKRAGVNKVLGVSKMDQDGKARAEMCDVNSTELATNFVFNTNGNTNNVFYFKEKNSSVYVNQRDGFFSNWTGGGNGDAGSSFRFYEVTDKETDLATELTNQKNVLNTAITNAEAVVGDGLGYYTSTKIEAAKAVYNATSATADDCRNALAALTPNQPEANTLYRLVSAYDGFENTQHVKKTIYAKGNSMMWGTEATSNPTEYWLFDPTANGFYLKNAATHAYVNTAAQLQNTASSVVTISWPLKDGKPVANIRTGNDSPFHAGDHNSGAGVSSSLMGYGNFGSETGGASAWYIVPATIENINSITADAVSARYPATDKGQVGLYPTNEVNALVNVCAPFATITSLDEAVNTFENISLPTPITFDNNKYYRFVNVGTSTNGNENTLGSKDGKAFCSIATNMNIDYVWQVLSAGNGKYNLKHATGLYLQPVQNGQTAKTVLGANESNYELRNTETGVFKLYSDGNGRPAQVETNASNTNYLNGWDGNNAKWKIFEVNYVEVPMNTVGEQKVATTCLPFDASNVAGAEVYTGKLNDAKDVLNMTKFEGGIPANQGVVLVGTADKATITIGATTATIGENDLRGTIANIAFTDDAPRANYLVFGKNGETAGFYAPSASVASIPANKAYLETSALSAAAIALNFNGTTTGVNTVVLGENGVNAPIFDLSGRRVAAPVKGGVYIQNGKKFIK